MTRLFLGLALGLAIAAFDPGPAVADGRHGGWHKRDAFAHHHRRHFRHRLFRHRHRGLHRRRPGRLHLGFGLGRHGWWWGLGASWYLLTRPAYREPPRAVYVPVPAPRTRAARPARRYCREYQGDAIIDGTSQRFYGTACLQPDGSWRIVN